MLDYPLLSLVISYQLRNWLIYRQMIYLWVLSERCMGYWWVQLGQLHCKWLCQSPCPSWHWRLEYFFLLPHWNQTWESPPSPCSNSYSIESLEADLGWLKMNGIDILIAQTRADPPPPASATPAWPPWRWSPGRSLAWQAAVYILLYYSG